MGVVARGWPSANMGKGKVGRGGEECDGIIMMCGGGFCCLTLIMVIILIACSLETIESTEMGIAYNAPQAILSSEVKEEGLHNYAPFGYFIKWPKTQETLDQQIKGLTKDGVVVTCQVAFQYKVSEIHLHGLTVDYKDYDNYKSILNYNARSGIRNACMDYTAQEFQTKRAAVQSAMLYAVKHRLTEGGMHALVLDLQLTQIDRPPAYETAVDNKEQARNNIDRIRNQKSEKITQANTALARVQVSANKTIATARTQAAVVTKQAEANGAIIYGQYQSQGALYKSVRETRGLSSEGLLAYIGTRLVDEMTSMTVGLEAPARMGYASSLNTTT